MLLVVAVACWFATVAVSCDGGDGGPTVDSASASLAIEGGQPLGTQPPQQPCHDQILYRFTPLTLTGNDGQDKEFEKVDDLSLSATYRDGQYYCDYSIYVPGIKAGRWAILVGAGAWRASCEKDFARNAFVIAKFRDLQGGCS
jgi:hypothetical protein